MAEVIIQYREKPHYLYALKDPLDRKIKYIGITCNIKGRIHAHSAPSNKYMNNKEFIQWRDNLRVRGFAPLFEILKKFDNYYLTRSAEKVLIHSLGSELLNIESNTSIRYYRV